MSILNVVSGIEEYLFSIVGFLGGLLIRGWFDRSMERQREFREAKRVFRETFLPERKILSPEVDSIKIPINWFKYLSDMDNRHQDAIIKIETFLRSTKRKALRKEWETYRGYKKNLPSWFDRDGFYKEEEKIAQMRQGAFQSLCNIIKIAGG